jgi:lipoprotein-anchoring transpeptidase ErfK/SrfK
MEKAESIVSDIMPPFQQQSSSPEEGKVDFRDTTSKRSLLPSSQLQKWQPLIIALIILVVVVSLGLRLLIANTNVGLSDNGQNLSAASPIATATSMPGISSIAQSGIVVPGLTPYPTAIKAGYPDPRVQAATVQKEYARLSNPGKMIVVSLAGQFIQAYENGKLVRWSYVTTGRPGMDTPRGSFRVFLKKTPVTFNPLSTDPTSAYFSYASKVQFGMEFNDGGYYIHDVWWRTAYGPGTNVRHWDPGRQEYSPGSHGCINTPFEMMAWLWTWTPMNTPVFIY